LTHFENYPQWNPFIKYVEGEVKVGHKIKVKIQAPDSKAMIFRPKVLNYDEGKILRWKGQLLVPGIFDGEHTFELIELSKEETLLQHSEVFTGLMIRYFDTAATEKGFIAMNQALESLCESVEVFQ